MLVKNCERKPLHGTMKYGFLVCYWVNFHGITDEICSNISVLNRIYTVSANMLLIIIIIIMKIAANLTGLFDRVSYSCGDDYGLRR